MRRWPTMLVLSGLWCTSCVLDRSSVSTGSVPLTQSGGVGTDNTGTSGGASGGAGSGGAPNGPSGPGDSGPGDPGKPGPTTVTIGPLTAKIVVGTQTTFSATASGGTDHAIAFSIVESGCGSISSAGVYQAPAVVPATTCTVRATNAASGIFADAKVTVLTAATAAKTVGPPSMSGDAGTITVDFNNVLVTLLPDFMGINGSSFWDSDPLNAHSRDAFKAVGIKTIRYPAGVPGNYFDWSADVVKCDSTTPNVSLLSWQGIPIVSRYDEDVREFLLVAVVGLVLGAVAAVRFLDPGVVILFARELMLAAVLLAIPFELAYFAGLALASRRGGFPRGWYWRSYVHHDRLRPGERRWVLACFAVGSLCMVVAVLGILAVVAAAVRAMYA